MQLIYEECGTTREQGKDTTTVYCFMYTVTCTVFLAGDTAPQHSFKESMEKTTLKDKGVRLDPWVFISWSLVDRKSSHKTVQVTCTLEVPRWGDPRRPVPTAASIATVEPRPCQGEVIRAPASNALRGTNGSFMLS